MRFMMCCYVGMILLQRFAVPALPVAVLLPFAFAAAAWGLLKGYIEVHRQRLVLWLVTVAVTAGVMLVQDSLLGRDLVSVTSWCLFMAVWAPFSLRLVDRRMRTYVEFLKQVTTVSVVLAGACLVMIASQVLGLAYRDWLADVVPAPLLLNGFVISYPVEYGSAIYRANAWIGLEPSIISAQLGLGLVAAVLTGARTSRVIILLSGLIATTSGSGFAIVAVALVVIISTSARHRLRRYAPAAALALVVGAASPMGATIWGRVTNLGIDPSLSLRAIAPYRFLWPMWTDGVSNAFWGLGPGSSQALISRSGVDGLLVATPIKVFFDYGLVAGGVLAAYMLFTCLDSPSWALAGTIAASMWTLQPASTASVVVLPLLLLVSWWAPRRGEVLERSFRLVRRDRELRPFRPRSDPALPTTPERI